MSTGDESRELNDFLRRVNEIESVVKGFSCDDAEIQQTSLQKADQILEQIDTDKIKFDRTAINKTPSQSQPPDSTTGEQDAFLRSLEADAADRTRKRKEGMKVATVWKDKGNVEFKAGNYVKAIEHYTEGTKHLKDMVVLYTNRAQAYNRLGKYAEALEDCEVAIFLEEKSVKAYIHQGKAYTGQCEYNKAIESYNKILTFDPKQEKIVKEYISQTNQAQKAAESETQAAQVFQSGDAQATNVVQVLDKLGKSDQPAMYYDGGMKILLTMIKDDTSRTLFRTHGGFNLLTDSVVITGCFNRVLIAGCADDTVDLVCSCMDLLHAVIKDNDENNKCLVQVHGFPDALLSLLGMAPSNVQLRCIQLMLLISENSVGRAMMVSKFDNIRLLVSLMTFVQNAKAGADDAAKILNNLALEKTFIGYFKDRVADKVLPAFENIMLNSTQVQAGVFPACLSFMGNMAHDVTIRKQMCNRKELWDASLLVMTLYSKTIQQTASEEVVYALLGLTINIALEASPVMKSMAPDVCIKTMALLESQRMDIKGRATGLISRMIPHLSDQAMDEMCDANLPRHLITILKSTSDDVIRRYASKTLAVLTQSKDEARRQVVKSENGLTLLSSLLATSDDIIIANVALCIGHCTEIPGVSSSLVGSGIIKTLLSKTHTVNSSIQQNCAITLAKLATSDERHLQEVKKLGGIGILSGCMKHVK